MEVNKKIKIGVDKPQPLCYNKDTKKEINQKERKYEHDEYSKIQNNNKQQ